MAYSDNTRLMNDIGEPFLPVEHSMIDHVTSTIAIPEKGCADAAPAVAMSSKPQREKFSKMKGPSKWQLMNQMYNLPAPVRTFPLPFFSPTNPLSLLQVAYTWLQQTISPPSSHPSTLYQGRYSPETQSIHITDFKSIRALWECGFYGKGTLSRSDPSWLDREKRKRGERAHQTSEEVTRWRRAERQQLKWERARKEREAIEETLLTEQGNAALSNSEDVIALVAEAQLPPVGPPELLALPNSLEDLESKFRKGPPKSSVDDEGYGSAPASITVEEPVPDSQIQDDLDTKSATARNGNVISRSETARSVRFAPNVEQKTFQPYQPPSPELAATSVGQPDEAEIFMEDQEHLQLTLEEALFLQFGFGVLEVFDPFTRKPLSSHDLLTICRLSSEFGPQSQVSMPDDSFMLSYVVYHHFRSLGWVVRSGIKFGVDYLLYNRGPPFSHAEFAITILPAYSHPYWSQSADRRAHVAKKTSQPWSWLHCINRVNTQVKKTLVLVYVEVPPPKEGILEIDMAITEMLSRYTVREIVLKRWSANRSRD